MLRASHRVLKPGGAICFLVITVADELAEEEMAEAIEAGPPAIEAETGYADLMAAADFAQISLSDVTGDYLETLTAWHREWEAESTELRRLVGHGEFDDRQAVRSRAIDAIAHGLLRRYLISATRI